jgi:hypothetical protein
MFAIVENDWFMNDPDREDTQKIYVRAVFPSFTEALIKMAKLIEEGQEELARKGWKVSPANGFCEDYVHVVGFANDKRTWTKAFTIKCVG